MKVSDINPATWESMAADRSKCSYAVKVFTQWRKEKREKKPAVGLKGYIRG